ncbi:hypothetical protein [Rhizobium sp. 18065]|uniref:hypothetical protein n=1 Tax=Rhizobium sp. 18065 TaxID=2681411 RepID=UPI0013567A04|nr:hypothetical protein [Rhizobium sp. 18065]
MNVSAQQSVSDMMSGIMSPVDLRVMQHAMFMACDSGDTLRTIDDVETLGRVVLKLYAAGLVDPEKLADAAGTMAGVVHIQGLRRAV